MDRQSIIKTVNDFINSNIENVPFGHLEIKIINHNKETRYIETAINQKKKICIEEN